MEARGIDYLRKKLRQKQPRIRERYLFYEMKHIEARLKVEDNPTEFSYLKGTLGWCGKAVDSLADRLLFREFSKDIFELNNIFSLNNPDTFFDSAILSALISACCFVYISKGLDGFPVLQVIDGGSGTGIIDPITGLLKEGYAILEKDENENPILEAYFLPYCTEYYEKKKLIRVDDHKVGYPLLVPIIHRPDAVRDFGRSRISRACMSLTKSALRTIKRSEISAEFYSIPQKYAVGLSQDAEPMEKWKATMSTILTFTKDEEGDSPKLGQFSQQSMSPYMEHLKMFASLFAGETGLTLDDLGFVGDNPSSAEAIKSSHENLRLMARKAQQNFGSGFLNVGFLSACLRDDFPYLRNQFYKSEPKWEPIFEPDSATLSSIGDGVIKINQAVPDYFNFETLRDLTGIKRGEGGVNGR